jgi:hypothetical protein
MRNSEMVTTQHLARKAVIYIRQSSPHQVLTNQESLALQYALRDRALELGWRREDVEVVDTDLGITGARAEPRAGFKDLLAEVSLGQVGLILSTEVTRLARNCSDWYPLLDLCSYKSCLIADREGLYDPATSNGRLLLGLNSPESGCTACSTSASRRHRDSLQPEPTPTHTKEKEARVPAYPAPSR